MHTQEVCKSDEETAELGKNGNIEKRVQKNLVKNLKVSHG